jgi:hypothetical protein
MGTTKSDPILVTAFALLVACACSSPYPDPEPGPVGPENPIAQVDNLFNVSPTDPALFDFETNESAYISDFGYTLWALKAGPQSPFVSRTVVLNKISGSSLTAGYGIVFCHHASGSAADERMLVVMINAKQEYIVGEAVGSSFSVIVPWTTSTYLNLGYQQDNAISVSLDSGTRVFSLAINGVSAVKTFSAMESDYDLNGGNGYLAVIVPQEKFPSVSVHITYKEQ